MSTAVSILYSLAVLFLLWAFYIYLGYRSKKRAWGNKVNEWFPEEKRKSFISVVGDRFDQSKQAEALSNKLIGANVPLLPSEYLGIHILGFFILFILLGKFFKTSASINILISIGILIGAHFLMFYMRKNKYEERFNDQLSDICRLLGSAAKSGLTISQGIDLVSKEIPAPAGKEFKGISNQLKLGVPLEIALRSIQKRNKSRDFQLFISTILIQTKTGGNLAATLETMSNTLEDRKILNQTIKTMTSEQRYVSFIVPALPIFILLVMNNVVDGFTDPLWTLPGIIILILFLLGIIISFILIRKISDIKV
ncbi:type II secretion system F family protein [Heyndrickxia oleronia]|jgi:tight adherence protein B|uniref:type II secretion system F family protein n=1 Tax=Heyndrickxia oleronia TaxID=38875 RepID=UPI001C0EE057|nr:type II secretion system F family protein [Heyndrickxia oleronia]MBU5214822.1 type II secretion system F family protein [Heyndrickxia oleronia]MCM3457168.1 type II secretion system F family protein [Heyndrickxia oleronia]